MTSIYAQEVSSARLGGEKKKQAKFVDSLKNAVRGGNTPDISIHAWKGPKTDRSRKA